MYRYILRAQNATANRDNFIHTEFGVFVIKKNVRKAKIADNTNEKIVDLVSFGLFECVPVV